MNRAPTGQPIHHRILEALDDVVDPCSEMAGAPTGLVHMGLVHELHVTSGSNGYEVRVVLAVTEPGCQMGVIFVHQARKNLESLGGIGSVDVSLTSELPAGEIWDEGQMSSVAQRALVSIRQDRLRPSRTRENAAETL